MNTATTTKAGKYWIVYMGERIIGGEGYTTSLDGIEVIERTDNYDHACKRADALNDAAIASGWACADVLVEVDGAEGLFESAH